MLENPFYGIVDERQDAFDATFPLPEPGENELLDSLCERKRITVGDLVRVGARWNPAVPNVLQFWWPDGVRFRDLITDRRWIDNTSDFAEPKIVPGKEHAKLVVVEGETDGARMSSEAGPGYDVLILGGATPDQVHEAAWSERATRYEQVFVATDTDQAGVTAAKRWQQRLGERAVRWSPPEGEDWCSLERIPAPPEPPKAAPLWVTGTDLFELEFPEVPSYLEHSLLPTTGLLVLHGWKGSYKSWLAFDLVVALATGGRWAEFEAIEPELRVGIVQFEVPPYHYRQRMSRLYGALPHEAKARFRNVHHFSPLTLPQWNAANRKHTEAFVAEAKRQELGAILFDPIRQMVGVASMNDQEAQQHVVQFFRSLNREGVAVVCTHHDSKTAARAGGGSMLDMTAGDVLVGAADSVVSVQLPKGDVHETSTRRNLRFFVRNDAPLGARGFRMRDELLLYQDEPWTEGADEEGTSAPGI